MNSIFLKSQPRSGVKLQQTLLSNNALVATSKALILFAHV